MKIPCSNPEAVAKRAFWLAWQACGGPAGMGFLQNRPGATEEDVWKNVFSGPLGGDYPGASDKLVVVNPNRPGSARADYVFGRMMKLGLEWDAEGVTVRDSEPRPDYQAWCRSYPTYHDLVEKAIVSCCQTSE